MPCYSPIVAFRRDVPGHKADIRFREFIDSRQFNLPCGRCVGCRLEQSRQWAVRIMHENSLHERSCFITLTYDEVHLPPDLSLDVAVWQKFAKRMRKELGSFRFFHAGEYGSVNFRPHYHAIIFGHDFSFDRMQGNISSSSPLFVSPTLQRLWPYGHHSIGDVTFESAAYVARYVLKKVTGQMADSHYERVRAVDGEIFRVAPEHVTMSRRPGIGVDWFSKYSSDVYPHDRVISRGYPAKPPRAYDKLLERDNPLMFEEIKSRRELANSEREVDTRLRLLQREAFIKSKLRTLSKRGDL